MSGWPVAALDPIQRAKVLAAAIPGAVYEEGIVDAPYAETWRWVTDFERSVPQFDTSVRRVAVRSRTHEPDGSERVRMLAWAIAPLSFDVRVEDGFCLMRGKGRLYLVIMAAVPIDGGARTRFLHMEAVPLPGGRLLRPIIRREVRSDLRTLTRLAPGNQPG